MLNTEEMIEDVLIAIKAAEAMATRDNLAYAIMMDLSVKPAHSVEARGVLEVVRPKEGPRWRSASSTILNR